MLYMWLTGCVLPRLLSYIAQILERERKKEKEREREVTEDWVLFRVRSDVWGIMSDSTLT